MPWVPIHQAFPDGTYYVDAGDDGLIPLVDHPEFSLINDRVVWEREVETLDGMDGIMQGHMPQVVFARVGVEGGLAGVPVRVSSEDRGVYSWCSSGSPAASFCDFSGGSVNQTWEEEYFGRAIAAYEWEYEPGSTQQTYEWGLGTPDTVEMPVHSSDANAVQYSLHCSMG